MTLEEAKKYLFQDYRDPKYKHSSIMDIYFIDKSYCDVLLKKTEMNGEIRDFLTKSQKELEKCRKIKVEGFRKLQCEILIEKYYSGEDIVSNDMPNISKKKKRHQVEGQDIKKSTESVISDETKIISIKAGDKKNNKRIKLYKTYVGRKGCIYEDTKTNMIYIRFMVKPDKKVVENIESQGWKYHAPGNGWYKQKSKDSYQNAKTVLDDEDKTNIVKISKTKIYVGRNNHNCNDDWHKTYEQVLDFRTRMRVLALYKCTKCKNLFYDGDNIQQLKWEYPSVEWLAEQNTENNKSILYKKNSFTKDISHIGIRDFLVRKHLFLCTGRKHEIRDIDAVVQVFTKTGTVQEVRFPASCCITCEKYYVLEKDYQRIIREGIPLCKSTKEELISTPTFNEMELSEQSILNMMGYNVSSQYGITLAQRHGILELVITNRVLTRTEVCNHLDFLIRFHRNRNNYKEAVDKWKEDRDYASNIKTGNTMYFSF